jgi:hypothetical protein
MNRTMWRRIVQTIRKVDHLVPRIGRRCRYSDGLVVKLWLWASGMIVDVLGVQAGNYSIDSARRLPSVSQLSRRLRTACTGDAAADQRDADRDRTDVYR